LADIRAALIASARAQMSREDLPEIDIDALCAEAGIGQAEFQHFFAGQHDLIAAVLEEDVAQLQVIADVAAAERLPRAMANGAPVSASVAAPPPPDAWLERRLRVFERALSAMEARQEKTEQLLNRSVALIEEKLAHPAEPPRPSEPETSFVAKETPRPQIRPTLVKAKPLPLPDLDPQPGPTPAEMDELLENARRAAREAATIEEPSVEPSRMPRWMTWAALGAILVMAVTALVLANLLGAQAGDVERRQSAKPALAHVTALADSGDPRSRTKLALAYLHGQNGRADMPAAIRWSLAAAKQGDPMAQYLLATFYAEGNGVAADPRQAFQWFEASALRGNLKAMHDLAIAYDQGQGTARDPVRASAWFNRAANQGYVDSQFDLAVLYERGDGVKQNPILALKWYLIAGRSGDAQARARSDQLEREMPAEVVAQARSLADNFKPESHDLIANTL
jgi:localization factor PodJL